MNIRNVKRKLAALVSADVVGYSRLMAWMYGWSHDPKLLDDALELGKKAVSLDESSPQGHVILGNVYLWKKRYKEAIAEFEKAVMALRKSIIKNPNFMPAHYVFAACYALHHMDGGRFLEPEMSTRRVYS